MGEKICKRYIWSGVNIQNTQRIHTTEHERKRTTQFKKWAEDSNRHFSKEHMQMANGPRKRCSASLIIRETRSKTMSCHLTAVRTAVIKKTTVSVSKHVGKGTLLHGWWDWNGFRCYGINTEVPRNIKNRNTISSNNSTPGYLSQDNENTTLKRYKHPYVNCSIIYNSRDMEATRVPNHREMDKDITHTHTPGTLHIHKKDEILPCATTWMDPEGIKPSEMSDRERQYCIMSFTHVIWETNERI